MTLTLSNKYYLQALDAYPYNLEEVMESLGYVLSYNAEHAGAHCLLGRLYMEHLQDYRKAEYHFEQAMIADMDYAPTYEYYSLLLIKTGALKRAEKIIDDGLKSCHNKPTLLHKQGLLFEQKQEFQEARQVMEEASMHSCDDQERTFLKSEIARIKTKHKMQKRAQKKERVLNFVI